jgi:hypothetical protein
MLTSSIFKAINDDGASEKIWKCDKILRLHGATSQKTVIFTLVAMGT